MPHDPSSLPHPPVHFASLAASQQSPLSDPGTGRPVLKAPAIEPITTSAALAEACERMARHPFVTVDTEFLRESTYYPLLCVAQMASQDEAIIIDALANGIDLAPFYDLMANEQVLKVFHAARQDIEIVWHQAGR